ncbi:glycosyltransferase family 4 protein [Aquirhabdus sp.]|uniref:glycosyltransferase family 4 protein n=1 Tax=Aquirhabdus sp. TaxID=2824160 RepID=UPI00396CEEB0
MLNYPLNTQPHQLLVDVSVIYESDSKTGIQRVVRALLSQLISSPPIGYRICPVYATRDHQYRYVPEQENVLYTGSDVVIAREGDVFLGLDLSAHLLPRYKKQLKGWKSKGVSIHIMVYDILPLTNPEWFNFRTYINFRRWIKVLVAFSDSAICISYHGKNELIHYLSQRFKSESNRLKVSVITLGADIEASFPSEGLPQNTQDIFLEIAKRPTILMVGTIEPRKGYLQTLLAFEELWRQGVDVNLVIIGRSGWKTEVLQRKMRLHPQQNIRLWWFENGSDELLKRLYNVASGVIVSSEAEGFGLPLVESILHGLPVLARDIDVFREVAGNAVTYFDCKDAKGLSLKIMEWLSGIASGDIHSESIAVTSWYESAKQLCRSLDLEQNEGELESDYQTLNNGKPAFVTTSLIHKRKQTFLEKLFSIRHK